MKRISGESAFGELLRKGANSVTGVGLCAAAAAASMLAAMALSSALLGLTSVASAEDVDARHALAPGFCAAPTSLEATRQLRLRPGERRLYAYVTCIELRAWRGDRDFEVIGQVIARDAAAPEEIETASVERPDLFASFSHGDDSDTTAQLKSLIADLEQQGGGAVDLGVLRDGGVLYEAALLQLEPMSPRLRMSAATLSAEGQEIRRDLIMPLRGGDTIRYMRALLSAELAAERIAGAATER